MVFVTGDTHGDITRLADVKLEKGDTLLICGDFGFIWDGSQNEERILRKLGKKKFNICFIDGTHENFELLDNYDVGVFCGGKAQNISGNLYHLMRGQIYTIEGKRYFAMGGGESPDIDLRFDIDTWSRREYPSREELTEGVKNLDLCGYRVDYIITHEPPEKIKGFLRLKSSEKVHLTGLNTYFEELNENCRYTRWFFGSMHLDKFISSSHTAVYKKIINVETGEVISSH